MATHTPGSWGMRHHSNMTTGYHFCVGAPDELTHEMGHGGEHVVCHVIGDENSEANARLIAAAPDLLEAARHALETIEDYINGGKNLETATVLRNAIAKAERGK